MGRKGPKAKTKTVLKSVSKWAQFGSMQNFKFQTLLNKNHPNIKGLYLKSRIDDKMTNRQTNGQTDF